ncbi:putative multidrug resistance protein [Podospora fimiseda]|uniref:Multidrug resistance protein n=1 Tax=Podospora fimiseda TaxID=252190 RepID=A0AAN7BXV7_9PEZI|nr:putative multidrug resistance protein [Podospora fimiseda]
MFSCLDTSIVSTALVSISVEYQNTQDSPWAVLGYLLTYMSFAVGFSKLSDIFGRKSVLVVAWLLFTLGSVWCGFAREMSQLIAGRAVQGIGGSGLYSLAQVCLVEQGPSRPELVGALVGITLSISFVLGPLFGGGISEWNWRGIFWLNIPFGVVAILGIYTLWPDERRNKYGIWTKIAKIDFIGNTLLALASILLVFALQEGGSFVWRWSSPVIIWSLTISGVCWVLLCIWESYLFYGTSRRIEPIFPMRLIVARVYCSTLLNTLMTGFVYIALVIKIPERLQIIYGDSALMAGVHLLPMLGSCAFGSFLGGAISKRVNLTSQTLIVGNALQVLGLGLVFGFARNLDLAYLLGFTSIYGLGVGLSFAACTIIAAIEAGNEDLASAQGSVAQARVFGGALGLAVCTIIFNEKLHGSLGPGSGSVIVDEKQLEAIHRSLMAVLTLSPAERTEVMIVYMNAFREQMLAMTVVAAVALVVAFGTYKKNPAPVVDIMAHHHKEAGGQQTLSTTNDTELESTSSVRSLMR